jgi:ribosome-associated protein
VTAESTVAIKDDMIRLGQFLKVADAVDQGSDVKALLATESVTVNGDVEVRRGRQLRPGDVVGVGTTTYHLTRVQRSTEGSAYDPASGRYSSGS